MEKPFEAYRPGTIGVPSYLLSDDELRGLIARLQEIAGETGGHDERASACEEQIIEELRKRGDPIRLGKEPA